MSALAVTVQLSFELSHVAADGRLQMSRGFLGAEALPQTAELLAGSKLVSSHMSLHSNHEGRLKGIEDRKICPALKASATHWK